MANHHITVGGIDFEIKSNARRTRSEIGFDAKGNFYIAVPAGTFLQDVIRLAEKNVGVLLKKLEANRRKSGQYKHSYTDGEPFYYRGETYPLRLHNEACIPAAALKNGELTCFGGGNTDDIKLRLAHWYARQLDTIVHKELPPLCKKIGKGPTMVHIKDVKTLWGSCSMSGSITFNIRLAMVPPKEMEYVMIHELCHFHEMNHSQKFWQMVEKFCPDYKKLKSNLKRDGEKYKW